MRTLFYLCMLLGLGLSSCEKTENSDLGKDLVDQEMITIQGKSYLKSHISSKFVKVTGVDLTTFSYDKQQEAFVSNEYDIMFKVSDYVNLK